MSLIYIDEPVAYDLPKIVQGEDWNWSFTLNNPDGTPVNTSGMSFACMMREKKDDSTTVFTPAIAVASNTITLTIANALTTAQTKTRRLVYDIIQTDSLGNKLALFEGSVAFEGAVTR